MNKRNTSQPILQPAEPLEDCDDFTDRNFWSPPSGVKKTQSERDPIRSDEQLIVQLLRLQYGSD